jgi:hypothetical protein
MYFIGSLVTKRVTEEIIKDSVHFQFLNTGKHQLGSREF